MLASKRNERSLLNEEEEEELDTHFTPSSDEHLSLRASSDDDELDEDRFESPEIMMNALFLLELTNPALKHALTEIEPLVLTRQLTTPRRTFEELYDIYKLKRKENERKLSRSFKLESALEPLEPRPSLFAGNRLPPLPVANPKDQSFAHPTYHTHPELYQQHVRAQQTTTHNPYDLSKWEDSSSDSSGSSSRKRRGSSYLDTDTPSLLAASSLPSSSSSMPNTRSRTRESEILANMGMASLAYQSPYLKPHPVSLSMPVPPPTTSAATPSSPTRKRRKVERKRATPEQVDMLEKIYASDRFPPTEVIKELADKLEMKQQKVKNWFQNKRAKERRMGVELIPPANNGSRRNSPKGSSASASSSSDEGSSKIEEGDKQRNESLSA